jgi:hypothetical protein
MDFLALQKDDLEDVMFESVKSVDQIEASM